jgi:hypothetical protein
MPDPAKPFLELDLPLAKKGIARIRTMLDGLPSKWSQCVAQAMGEWLENLIEEARNKAPAGQGGLRESAQVVGPTITPASIDAQAGFNKVYARIQDQGGEIRPVKAKALFIPLRPGVVPVKGKEAQKATGWKYGIDFVFAQLVTLTGNRYFSAVLAERLPKAIDQIGARAWQLFTAKKPPAADAQPA